MSPRPARLHRFWEGLPTQVKVIQAAYARHPDGRILLFSGQCGPGLGAGALARGMRSAAHPGPRPARRPAVLVVPGPAARGRRKPAHRAGAAPRDGGGRRVLLAAQREDLPDPGAAVLAVGRGCGAPGPRLPARSEPLGGRAAGSRRCHRQQQGQGVPAGVWWAQERLSLRSRIHRLSPWGAHGWPIRSLVPL